jgi:hypothetical protein
LGPFAESVTQTSFAPKDRISDRSFKPRRGLKKWFNVDRKVCFQQSADDVFDRCRVGYWPE